MSNTSRDTVLCRYHYDPLDRQNGCTVLQQPAIQRFHCKSRLTTEIQGAARWSILQHDDQLLAQQSRLDAKVGTTLLATDQQRSILNALDATQPNPLAYTPYGHRPAENGLLSLLGFNGERPDPVTGHYHLGNGYRQFNPVLMRFIIPDSWSPFGEGGLNAYAYCLGDPINRIEVEGHASSLLRSFWKGFKNLTGMRTPSKYKVAMPASGVVKTNSLITPTPVPKSHQGNSLKNAKDFDVNTLSPAEMDLNYRRKPNETLANKIPVTYIKDPKEKLANLLSARESVSKRIISDSPKTRARRLYLLDNINTEIAGLTTDVKHIRNQHQEISI
ncbi:hypothetical protein D3C85_792570 [compost metagenome]